MVAPPREPKFVQLHCLAHTRTELIVHLPFHHHCGGRAPYQARGPVYDDTGHLAAVPHAPDTPPHGRASRAVPWIPPLPSLHPRVRSQPTAIQVGSCLPTCWGEFSRWWSSTVGRTERRGGERQWSARSSVLASRGERWFCNENNTAGVL